MATDDTQPDISQIEKTTAKTHKTVTPSNKPNAHTPRISKQSFKKVIIKAGTPKTPAVSPVARTPVYKRKSQEDQQKSNSIRRRIVTTPKDSLKTAAAPIDTKTTQSSEEKNLDDEQYVLSPLIAERILHRAQYFEDFGPHGQTNFIKYKEVNTTIRNLRKQTWMVYVDQVVKIGILLLFVYSYYTFHYVYHYFELKTTPEYEKLANGFLKNGYNFERCLHENWTSITLETVQNYSLEACDSLNENAMLIRKFKSKVKDQLCVDRYELYKCINNDKRIYNLTTNLEKELFKHHDCPGTMKNPQMYTLQTHTFKIEQIDLMKYSGKVIPSSYIYSRCPVCAITTRLLRDKTNPDLCFHKVRRLRSGSPITPNYQCIKRLAVSCDVSESPFLNDWGKEITEKIIRRTYVHDSSKIPLESE